MINGTHDGWGGREREKDGEQNSMLVDATVDFLIL